MGYVVNAAANFAAEALAGYAAANGRVVRPVEGGVARTDALSPGSVAVVVGGGSGHYPAFAGLVGRGLASAAAVGDIFASPSSQRVYSVAKSVEAGGGVLFAYGNYAGDVLNFDLAQQRLIDEGIPCRTVVVTDDVSSSDDLSLRRGIAGSLFIYKIAGAAAEGGAILSEVADLACRANERTTTIGVAFGGCSMPGAQNPLFSIPRGMMAVGMGVHGEPGLSQKEIPTADDLAEMLVTTLLEAAPHESGERVGLILNGLGSVKYDELFIVYRRVSEILEARAITVIEPIVGEYVTSFDMAGLSLTLSWLDDDLERLWRAPAETSAFYRTAAEASNAQQHSESPIIGASVQAIGAHSPARSPELVAAIGRASIAVREVLDQHKDGLGLLDSVAGDGDHGLGMARGSRAAAEASLQISQSCTDPGAMLRTLADAWSDEAGGTSGALWGEALRAAGWSLTEAPQLDAAAAVNAVQSACAAIAQIGRAAVGDKTMLDAFEPFARVLAKAVADGKSLREGWSEAASAATDAAAATAALSPRIGRARPHGDRSVGTADPGAVSFGLIVTAICKSMCNWSRK